MWWDIVYLLKFDWLSFFFNEFFQVDIQIVTFASCFLI